MKTLLFTNLYPTAQAPTRGMDNVSVFGAISTHCEVRLVAPMPWWSRVQRPWEWFAVPRETTTGIDASFPTYWSIPGRHALHGEAIYRSLRHYVERLRRDFPFDVILAAGAYPDAYAAARLARDFGCPLVTNVLGSDIDALARMPELARPIRMALGQSHRVIAASHGLRERVLELGIAPDKVIVLHNEATGMMVPPGDAGALADVLDATMNSECSADDLRETVPCRSWEEAGKGYYAALASAAGISTRPQITPRSRSGE
jgi:hypothetical protein